MCNDVDYSPLFLWDRRHVTRNLMHEQRTNSIGQCMYMYLCTVSSEGSMSSMKDQLYECTKSSCQKEYLYRGKYTESRYIKSVACTNNHNSSLINGIECMCMSQCL